MNSGTNKASLFEGFSNDALSWNSSLHCDVCSATNRFEIKEHNHQLINYFSSSFLRINTICEQSFLTCSTSVKGNDNFLVLIVHADMYFFQAHLYKFIFECGVVKGKSHEWAFFIY